MNRNLDLNHFLFLSLAVIGLVVPRHATAAGYTITDLGTLKGGFQSYAQGLNASGQVTGYANTTFGYNHAFLYSGGHLTDLRTLGGSSSYGRGINSAGAVVGYSQNNTGSYRAFLYNGGKMKDLGTLGGSASYAFAINDSGQVAGSSYPAGNAAQHAFLYSGGPMMDLGTLGGSDSYAYGLNSLGQVQVVGESHTIDPYSGFDAFDHAFLWTKGAIPAMTDLGTLSDGSTSAAYAINSSDWVVGYSYTAGDSAYTPVLWQNGSIMNLGSFGGTEGMALGINSSGQVVGWSANNYAVRHAFLWQQSGGVGVMTDLNNLIPANSGWQLFQATAINDIGQIVGSGARSGQFNVHAFLMTPAP